MTCRICLMFVLSVVLGLLLTACAGPTPSSNNPPPPVAANPAPGKVPNSLAAIEAEAEDIIDRAPGGQWPSINADITTTAEAWKEYQSQGLKDGATPAMVDSFNSALDRLQTAAAAQDKAGTMQAANDMSAVVVELFDLYHPTIPAAVGQLDVLERQVKLDVAAGNYAAANDNLAKVNQVWEALKPSVLDHQGEDTAKQFEASIAAQANAISAQDANNLTHEADAGLELVDDLERLY